MTDAEVLAILKQTSAIRKGHFNLTSGRHSDTYIQCARVLEHPQLTQQLAAEAVRRLPDGLQVDIVISPAVGGILFGFSVAFALDVSFIFTERVAGAMQLRRSFEIPKNARLLVVEDVVTTGGSVQEVIKLAEAAEARIVGVVSLISRGGAPVFCADFYPLIRLEVPSWLPEHCALCAEGKKLTAPGSRNLVKQE